MKKNKNDKKTLAQRIIESNVLGDGNLMSVTPSDILTKSFEAYSNEELMDEKEEKE